MAKSTTSVFTVKVTHRGNKKDFLKLFKPKGGQTNLEHDLISTETVESEVNALYTNEQKMVRLFLKKCCEKAGLQYMGVSKDWGIEGGYALEYGNCWKDGSKAGYTIHLNDVRIDLRFSNGLDSNGVLEVFDHNNVIQKDETNNSNKPWIRYSYKVISPNEEQTINMADPNFEDELVSVLEKWGFMYE